MSWQAPPTGVWDDLKGQVHVWRVLLSANSVREQHEKLLSVEERERACRFAAPGAERRFVATRACLRLLISRYSKVSPAELRFQIEPSGRPVLEGGGLCFNVSHSGEMALLAFSEKIPVGVDVEWMKHDRDFMALARRYFHAEEILHLERATGEERFRIFYRFWTLKESLLKAGGEGLGALSQIEWRGDPEKPELHVHGVSPPAWRRARVQSLPDPAPDYAAALAILDPDLKIKLYDALF